MAVCPLGEVLRVLEVLRRTHVFILRSTDEGEDPLDVSSGVPQGEIVGEGKLKEALPKEDYLLGAGEDGEVGIET